MVDATRLGLVVSVTGSTVHVELLSEAGSGLVFVEGHAYRVGQVGSFLKIPQGYATLFAVVSQAGVAAAPTAELASEPRGRRWLVAELAGECHPGRSFDRGVSQYPSIGDAVHLVTEDDLRAIYGTESSRDYVEVGHLSSTRSVSAYVEVNRLVTRHGAVLGATGSGKSTTVAGLLHRLSDESRFPSARVLVLDIHGEYAVAFPGRSRVSRISPNVSRGEEALQLPFWALTFDELLPLTFGVLDDTSRGYVQARILELKRAALAHLASPGIDAADVTVDSPVPFSIRKLWYDLSCTVLATYPKAEPVHELGCAAFVSEGDAETVVAPVFENNDGHKFVQGKGPNHPPLNMRRQLERLGSRLRDSRLDFLLNPGPYGPSLDGRVDSDLAELMGLWLGGVVTSSGDTDSKPIVILDLSGVPGSILVELVGVVIRLVYDALFWARNLSEGGRERPLLVVLEEAHVYLGVGDGPAALAVKRVVKEGRKYGVGALVVSQRPAEVDQTILSQCGTLFAMRLNNSTDRGHVTSAMSDGMKGLLEMLPALRTGESIILGEAVRLPTRALIRLPRGKRRPESEDPRVVAREFGEGETGPGGWDRAVEVVDYSDLATVWRRQDPESPHAVGEREE